MWNPRASIVFRGNRVWKHFPLRTAPEVIQGEVKKLLAVRHLSYCQKISQWNSRTIVSAYCGEQLSETNLPDDWQLQCEEIIRTLPVQHGDIRIGPRGNLSVLNGKIMLLDFWWDWDNPGTQNTRLRSILKIVHRNRIRGRG